MNKKLLGLLVLTAFLPSCLQTAADLRNNPNRPQQQAANQPAPPPPPIVTKQQKEAVEALHNDDINRDFREMNGRIEVLENQMGQLKEDEKNKALEAKVAQLETKIGLLEQTVTELNNQNKKLAAANGVHGSDLNEVNGKGESIPYQEATKLFEKGKWEDAVLAYEEYRKNNPGGKYYADATYKIGLCFQNLGSKGDAKAFFKEVVDKYPKSKEANLAKSKLKKL